jgi:hypothetical protein
MERLPKAKAKHIGTLMRKNSNTDEEILKPKEEEHNG